MVDDFRIMMAYIFSTLALVMLWYIYMMPSNPFPTNEGFMDANGRCGPNLGTCPDGLRCLNGYCKSDIPPALPPLSDLPIRPNRYTYPVPAPSLDNVTGIKNCQMVD